MGSSFGGDRRVRKVDTYRWHTHRIPSLGAGQHDRDDPMRNQETLNPSPHLSPNISESEIQGMDESKPQSGAH